MEEEETMPSAAGENHEHDEETADKDKGTGGANWAQLSGIGLQMGVTIFLGAFFGKYLDDKYPSNKRWFTILFTLLAVSIALYNALRQVNRINERKK